MKAFPRLRALALLALTPAAFAQEAQITQLNGQGTIVVQEPADPFGNPQPAPPEKPFSLEFAGGPVREFVTAVEKATGAPFNVIIPASAQDLEIPPVKVKGVTLRPLLAALSESSTQRKAVPGGQGGPRMQMQPGGPSIQYAETGFSFSPSEPGPQAVWQLTVRGLAELPAPPAPPPTVRFYQLKPLLESGLKVEDITTAAETAWKMMKLAQAEMPELKYHEETGLLIAAGSETALMVIDSVLQAQPQQRPMPAPGTPGRNSGGLRSGGGGGFGNPTIPPQILQPSPNVAPPPVVPSAPPSPRVPALPKN